MDFVEFREKMLKCLQLQDELNSKINPNWKEERMERDFFRAVWLETAELMEELPWKWWKKVETDYDNLQIEVVDIFHFLLSLALLKDYRWKKYNASVSYIDMIVPFFYLALENSDELNTDGLMIKAEDLVKQSLSEKDTASFLIFAEIVKTVFEDFDKLYLLYIGKNILNHIRQEKGYKSGTYQKVIGGLEDNKYLTQAIKQVKSEEELEKEIRKAFEEINKE
jgi:dimeric dUTPase (all-alpha-NTP-PPase superfamily)